MKKKKTRPFITRLVKVNAQHWYAPEYEHGKDDLLDERHGFGLRAAGSIVELHAVVTIEIVEHLRVLFEEEENNTIQF